MNLIQFDKVARSERYFTSTILSHILMVNGFIGLKELFKNFYEVLETESPSNDFEIVSELDPLRDGSVYCEEVKKLFTEYKRVAVPDIFLRWSNYILIIEAKFFTFPTIEELLVQIKAQKQAINLIKSNSIYRNMNIQYILLTINEINDNDKGRLQSEKITLFTWEKLYDLLLKNNLFEYSVDAKYCQKILLNSINRAKQELDPSRKKVSYSLINNLNDLINKLPDLINNGNIYIGFSEGIQNTTLEDLMNRSHYKVSDTQWSNNWISLDIFLKKLFELKNFQQENIVE